MEWNRRQGRIAAAIVLLAASGLLVGRLSAFGIWDPWELSAADLARDVASGNAPALTRPPLATWLVAQGFSIFGVHEWSGRLPMAFAGLIAVGLAYLLVARFAGRQAGAWAAIIAVSSPLLLFNARQMLGAAPGFAASAGVFLCALSAVFLPTSPHRSLARQKLATVGWMAGLALSMLLAALASGVLLGVAPPLLGVAVAVVARNELRPGSDRRRAFTGLAVLASAIVIAGGVAHAIWADYGGFGIWTGGVPRDTSPPTWEVAIERLFHSFAPWSALLPLAVGRLLWSPPKSAGQQRKGPTILRDRSILIRHPEEGALRLALVGWLGFGLLAQTLFTARYGSATFLPLVGAAAAVALMLRDVERSQRAWWGAGLVALLFVGLILRDYRAYPGVPISGLPVDGIEVPDVFRPTGPWAAFLGAFAALFALGLATDPRPGSYPSVVAIGRDLAARWREGGARRATVAYAWLRLGVPTELLARQWKRGLGTRLWLLALALVLAVVTIFGFACLLAPAAIANLGMTSLGLRIGRALVLLVPGLVLAIAAARLAFFGVARLLGRYRLVPGLLAGLAVGAYASFGYQSALSSHFSPREVYDTYNELAADGEPLGEFRVGGRAATYYAKGDVEELASQAELVRFLRQDKRVWAAFRADDLASVNREYRRHAGRHLFIADARSARMVLATNHPVEGRRNQNYLADAILDTPPRPQHPVNVNFDDRIELLGIDLDLPHEGYVGPGERFGITWYFRVLAPVPGSYKPFVHIDGPGQRINGDHDPVDGRYPVRLWEPGDIVVDRQQLSVPANYQRGNLTIYMGFFSGEQRLEVVRGPKDDANRARVGVLPIR